MNECNSVEWNQWVCEKLQGTEWLTPAIWLSFELSPAFAPHFKRPIIDLILRHKHAIWVYSNRLTTLHLPRKTVTASMARAGHCARATSSRRVPTSRRPILSWRQSSRLPARDFDDDARIMLLLCLVATADAKGREGNVSNAHRFPALRNFSFLHPSMVQTPNSLWTTQLILQSTVACWLAAGSINWHRDPMQRLPRDAQVPRLHFSLCLNSNSLSPSSISFHTNFSTETELS